MPEYSGTTITPSDGVQVPGMNGNTSGNFLLSALKSYILSEKGLANGLASLDANGKLLSSQLPDLADDVIVVASYATLPATGTAGKIYITADNNKGYRWDPELTTPGYVKIFEIDKSIVFGYYSSGSFYEDSEHTVQITPVEHVLYVDVSLADIYVLNDGTLIELLGTKWAKITDIQDGTIQAGIAVKAFQDAMGRAIITTYATKAELSAEESSREAADTGLKDAIDANSKRITNLETKAGDEIPVTYPSATYGMDGVPASVAPYGKVRELIMNSRVTNNYAHTSNVSDTIGGLSFTMSADGYFSIGTGTATSNDQYGINWLGITVGHFYLISEAFATRRTSSVYISDINTKAMDTVVVNTSNWNSGDRIFLYLATVNGSSYNSSKKYYPILTDLNQYFNSNDLSFLGSDNDEKLATIQRDYPELLVPSDYDTGTRVDTTYSAVKSYLVDDYWHGTTEAGYINPSTGQNAGNGNTSYKRCADYVAVEPNTEYNLCFPANGGILLFYGSDKSYLGYVDGSTQPRMNPPSTSYQFKTANNVYFVRFWFNAGPNSGDLTMGSKQTLTLPTPVTGKSAGSVHEVYDLETGKKTNQISATKNLVELTWGYNAESMVFYTNNYADSVVCVSNAQMMNILCNRYITEKFNDIRHDISGYKDADMSIGCGYVAGASNRLVFRDDRYNATDIDGSGHCSFLEGVTIIYELATPDPDSQATEPVNDPFLKVEGGGTIRPVQSQTTQIDSAMSVDYLGV